MPYSANPAAPPFAHIYYEHRAAASPLARMVRQRYAHLPSTEITNYTEIFNRKKQHFQIQKRAQALVLAVAQPPFLYRGTERITHRTHIYYTDQMRNCIYNCQYCFLQGMHQSAHCVLFVNEHDYHRAALEQMKRHAPLHLSISYLSDLLGVEQVIPLCRGWIEVARNHNQLQIEIRTKSNNIHPLYGIEPTANVRLVWSLTPRQYAQHYEHGTASLPNRLISALRAIELGWQVSLCFDPIIFGDGWEQEYRTLLQETFALLPADKIASVTYGTFRMHREYFRRIFDQQPENDILQSEYEHTSDLTTHPQEVRQQIRTVFEHEIEKHYSLEKVFFVHG